MLPDSLFAALIAHPITLDQTSTPLLFEREEIDRFYAPIARRILARQGAGPRLLAAVAGPPGAGKTAFATLLVAVLNALLDAPAAVLIQQDGWHYPNAYLDSHTILYEGQEISLRRRKGSPESYDTQTALACLRAIHQGQDASYPVYSRALHDPVRDAGTVTAAQRIAVIEGNYWLLQEAPWTLFQPLFDVTIFLSAALEAVQDGLVQRHLRGGKTPEFTARHMDFVDLPNIRRVLAHSAPAQITVHKRDCRAIDWVEFKE